MSMIIAAEVGHGNMSTLCDAAMLHRQLQPLNGLWCILQAIQSGSSRAPQSSCQAARHSGGEATTALEEKQAYQEL